MRSLFLILLFAATATGQSSPPVPPVETPDARAPQPGSAVRTTAPDEGESEQEPAAEQQQQQRTQLNLLGQTDTKSGESRRNENIQFNLIDNNAQKELNLRIGATATLVQDFKADRNWFGAEYGGAPAGPFLAAPVGANQRSSWRGRASWGHLNSALSARAFFQVGPVLPARENEFAVNAGGRLWNDAFLSLGGSLRRIRGMVNGNVLIPLPSERTPLATDPALRTYVQRILDAYPNVTPNRTDIDPRMLNTNSPQQVNSDAADGTLDQRLSEKDVAVFRYSFLTQKLVAFQFVKGQNPDSTTRSHNASATWNRTWSPSTVSQIGFRFDRTVSLVVPENNNLGPQLFISNALTQINPQNAIPINRALNQFRTAAQLRRSQGRHNWTAGFETIRRQLNGRESDAHLGAFNINNNFGNDAITNLRLGKPTTYFQSIGETGRGFRYWEHWFYGAGQWNARTDFTLSYGFGYRPITRPSEVNDRNRIPYYSDWNNFGPFLGIAWKPGMAGAPAGRPRLGVIRAAFGTHYGEIFPVTFQQIRFNPPGNYKLVLQDPDFLNPLGGRTPGPGLRTVLYDYPRELVSPYSMQYNFSWELEPARNWRWQLGYVGSRAVKLLHHWYLNRAHPRPGIPYTTATIDQRRTLAEYSDIRRVTNGSRAYFDAFRTSLSVSSWRRLNIEASYWFSKALDLGSDYTNVAQDNDSFRARSQYEYDVHRDMKGRSRFDQPHAVLLRANYDLPKLPRRAGRWNVSSVILSKSGTPFNLQTGSDAPGFGNADGIGGDRPNLLDTSILGRSIDHPDRARQLLPRSAFSFVALDQRAGTLGRHVFRRGPIRNWNAALSGEFPLPGERRLGLRGEAINLTNSPQFAEPGISLTDPNFGVITNTLNDGRTFRLLLSLSF